MLTYPEIHLRSSARKTSVKACTLRSDFRSSPTMGSFHRSGARVLCGRVHASSWDEVTTVSTRGTIFFNSTLFTKLSSTANPSRTKSVSRGRWRKIAGGQLWLTMDDCDSFFRLSTGTSGFWPSPGDGGRVHSEYPSCSSSSSSSSSLSLSSSSESPATRPSVSYRAISSFWVEAFWMYSAHVQYGTRNGTPHD